MSQMIVEVKPLQPPFPDGVKFISFENDRKRLAVSAADYRLIVGLFGEASIVGKEIMLEPVASEDVIRIRVATDDGAD